MIAWRTRHCLSSASSMIAGRRACASSWMPMTADVSVQRFTKITLTLVDHVELADQVQPDLGELVLEQLEEQRQQVLGSSILAE